MYDFKLKNIFVESIEEIIAKKVYSRCEDANARDLFDLVIAIYKTPRYPQ